MRAPKLKWTWNKVLILTKKKKCLCEKLSEIDFFFFILVRQKNQGWIQLLIDVLVSLSIH